MAEWQKRVSEYKERLVARLAEMTALDYDQVRESEANKLGVRVSTLDKEVAAARKKITGDIDNLEEYKTGVEPYDDTVKGELLADEIKSVINRYCVLPKFPEFLL